MLVRQVDVDAIRHQQRTRDEAGARIACELEHALGNLGAPGHRERRSQVELPRARLAERRCEAAAAAITIMISAGSCCAAAATAAAAGADTGTAATAAIAAGAAIR